MHSDIPTHVPRMADYSSKMQDEPETGYVGGGDAAAEVRFMTERGRQTGELYYWGVMSPEVPKILHSVRGARVSHIAAGSDHVIVVTDEGGGRARFLPDIPETKDPDEKDLIRTELGALEQGTAGIYRSAVGSNHTLVSTSQGEVYAWGRGEQGQLGLPHALGSPSPQLLATLVGKNIVDISAGESHSAAVADNGGLYCWGSNAEGQCGIGKGVPFSTILTPRFVPSFLGVHIVRVSCGARFTACVTQEGEIWAWGEGGSGQLGCGRYTRKLVPHLAAAASLTSDGAGFADVACGWSHCLGLSRAGEVFSWGLNVHGQLGLGDTIKRHVPEEVIVTAVDDGTKLLFSQISAGKNYSAALTMAGGLYCWGTRFKGHGGGDSNVLSPIPVELTNGKNFSFVACGESHVVAFAPTGVRSIFPNAGPTEGGTDLTIYVDGVWDCEEILVRFYNNVPVTDDNGDVVEGEMEVIAETQTGFYDASCSAVKVATPPWFPAEAITVEITVNGFDYTANGLQFTYYETPEIHDVTPTSGPVTGGTQIAIAGSNFVKTDSLKVRFRTVIAEGQEGTAECFFVTGRFVSPSCIECNTPTIFDIADDTPYVSLTVDIALNGVDYTEAGVTFDMLNIRLSKCSPSCAPRAGGKTILIHGVNLCEVDEPILVKFAYEDGRERVVVGELVAASTADGVEEPSGADFIGVSCLCPALDGSEAPALPDNTKASNNDPVDTVWASGYGNEALTVHLSMNGGVDFIATALPFTAYMGWFNGMEMGTAIVSALGGTVLDIRQPVPEPPVVSETAPVEGNEDEDTATPPTYEEKTVDEEDVTVAADENAVVEDETAEGDEEGEKTETIAGDDENTEVDADVINNFQEAADDKDTIDPTIPFSPWLFSGPDTKIRFTGAGQDIIAPLDYDQDRECLSCIVPGLLGAADWLEYTLNNIDKEPTEEEDGAEDLGEEEEGVPKPPSGPTIKMVTLEVHIAMDGVNFMKVGSIDFVPPPVIRSVEPADDVIGGTDMVLKGDFGHCGLKTGTPVSVRVTHVGTKEEYETDGTVADSSITFVMPEVDYGPGQTECKVEVAVDQLNFTAWDKARLNLVPVEEEAE